MVTVPGEEVGAGDLDVEGDDGLGTSSKDELPSGYSAKLLSEEITSATLLGNPSATLLDIPSATLLDIASKISGSGDLLWDTPAG